MSKPTVTLADIEADPRCISTIILLPSGQAITFRPLVKEDASILGVYFLSLSDDTKRRYAPHPFDQATADQLCANISYPQTIRMIATQESGGQEQVIAYFILVPGTGEGEQQRYARAGIILDPQADCTIAPSVADAYQNSGLGSRLMQRVCEIARQLGMQRMVLMGGVQATNNRGIHYYQKNGFHIIGSFENPPGYNNYDMIVQL